jgi:hypothetical protein
LNGNIPKKWNAKGELILICIKLALVFRQIEISFKSEIIHAISMKLSKMTAFLQKGKKKYGIRLDYY